VNIELLANIIGMIGTLFVVGVLI